MVRLRNGNLSHQCGSLKQVCNSFTERQLHISMPVLMKSRRFSEGRQLFTSIGFLKKRKQFFWWRAALQINIFSYDKQAILLKEGQLLTSIYFLKESHQFFLRKGGGPPGLNPRAVSESAEARRKCSMKMCGGPPGLYLRLVLKFTGARKECEMKLCGGATGFASARLVEESGSKIRTASRAGRYCTP